QRSYTTAEKRKVVSYAKAHGNRATSREFDGIAESNIRLWRRQKECLQALPRMKMTERGKSAAYPELEAKLVEWIAERRQQGGGVSIAEVRLKALTIAKASHGWGNRFMNSHGLSVRCWTTIAQKLPMDSDTKVLQFQKFIIKLHKQHCYDLSLIDNPYNRMLEVKGAKTISIATTGHEKSRFTVMLACTADGMKLLPYIVLKHKTMPNNVIFPNTVHVSVHPKGWIDEPLMLDWLQMVWVKRPGGLMRKRSLMVLDAFWCHHMKSVKKRLQQDKTDLAIIPGGMTKILQPLDVTVNKPMKDALRRKWNTWLWEGEHTFTASGCMKTPTLQDLTQWIADVWVELDPAIIRKGFLKCSIFNAMDGSEDDSLW
uniref:HTH CENPB-type domain-containing protein n=1 Tax=Pelodiscus sinensis TaxID=13735 RepID=K7GCQ4_PELSI